MENESVEEFYKDVTELIAKVCHNVNKAYCEATGLMSMPIIVAYEHEPFSYNIKQFTEVFGDLD